MKKLKEKKCITGGHFATVRSTERERKEREKSKRKRGREQVNKRGEDEMEDEFGKNKVLSF